MVKRQQQQQQQHKQKQKLKTYNNNNQVDSEDDEEIDEDEAFNSDDERKYGSFFDNNNNHRNGDDHVTKKPGKRNNNNEDDDEEKEDSEDDDDYDDDESDNSDEDDNDDDEDQDDGGQYMLDLLKNLDEDKSSSKNDQSIITSSVAIAPHVPESQYASSVIPNAQLTLDSLMDGIQDTKGYGNVQKVMKQIVKDGQRATSAPVAKVISDRIQRQINYEIQSKEISLWSKAVQENRHAETLDFRPKQRLDVLVTRDQLIDQFVPTTDYEKEIHAALQEAGEQDDENMLQRQQDALDDDLGTNTITIEEYKKRHGQLAKMRALMFYHEQKRHHINKIKSKKYRKIRKKQKERMTQAELDAQMHDDPNLIKELEEKEEVLRMKERASLAHKNTSKWAKRILKRGKNVDVDTRRALSAQLQRGDALRQRMTTTNTGSDDDDSDNDDLVSQARKVLADTENSNNGDDTTDGLGKGLLQLAFMKKGIEKQRERAKEEARQLLMELEDDENDDDDEDSNSADSDDRKMKEKPKKKIKIASAKDMVHIIKDDSLVVESLKHGTAGTITMSGTIDIDTTNEGFVNSKNPLTNTLLEKSNIMNQSDTVTTSQRSTKAELDINPWMTNIEIESEKNKNLLVPSTNNKNTSKSMKAIESIKQQRSNRLFVDVDRAVDLLENKDPIVTTKDDGPGTMQDDTNKSKDDKKLSLAEKNITTLTQEELVKRAFATQKEQAAVMVDGANDDDDDDDDDDDSFAKEKARIEEDEDPTRRIKKEKEMKVSKGWGTWAGEGAKPPGPLASKKLRSLPRKLQPPPLTNTNKRPRADAKKPNVIISEKRISKLADKYMIQTVPYPYTTREEYERSMNGGGIGREWNVTDSYKDMTRPEIYTRAGKIIQPLSKKVKQVQRRGPAKF